MHKNMLLMVLLILSLMMVLSPLPVYAQGTVTYIENFQSNINGWWVGEDQYIKAEIANGRYFVERKADTNWMVWPIPVPFDSNRDFRIESSMRLIASATEQGYGILWGLIGEGNYNYFVLARGQRYGYGFSKAGKYNQIQGNQVEAILPVPQLNRLSATREGTELLIAINNMDVGRMSLPTAFGNIVGLHVGAHSTIEVDDLAVTTESDKIPAGWSIISEGAFKNAILWPDTKNETTLRGNVYNHGKLTAGKYIQGTNVLVRASLKTTKDPRGESAGLFLQTDEGARLKITRYWSTEGVKVSFSASLAGKDMGSKEGVLPRNASTMFLLRRSGDTFIGEVITDGKKTEVGRLTWPNLSANQYSGVIMEYDNLADNAPASFGCDFSELYTGTTAK